MLQEKTLDELRNLFGIRAMVRVLQYQAVFLSALPDHDPECDAPRDMVCGSLGFLSSSSEDHDKIVKKFLRIPMENEDSAQWSAHALLACYDFQDGRQYDGFQGCVAPTLLECMRGFYITSGDPAGYATRKSVEKQRVQA